MGRAAEEGRVALLDQNLADFQVVLGLGTYSGAALLLNGLAQDGACGQFYFQIRDQTGALVGGFGRFGLLGVEALIVGVGQRRVLIQQAVFGGGVTRRVLVATGSYNKVRRLAL